MNDSNKNILFKRNKLEKAYSAHIFDVYNDYLTMPNGKDVIYDLIDHADGVCVLPVFDDGDVLLVSQYRNAIDNISFEIPGGLCNDGEEPGISAKRELEEETGYIVSNLEYVTKTVLCIGLSNETTSIYIGKGLKKGNVNLDENEFINIHKVSPIELKSYIKDGLIIDSKTLIAIYYYLGQLHIC